MCSIQCMQGTFVAAFLFVRSMHIAASAFRLGILNSEEEGVGESMARELYISLV